MKIEENSHMQKPKAFFIDSLCTYANNKPELTLKNLCPLVQ